ncbi:nucleoside triphosphate pyrophosphatase [Henriciella sp. AS95]|uniref:Maf family protein n=1 Tax=Henriciella sp. AS95 TaxID=3135782 RepID=UPI003179E25B
MVDTRAPLVLASASPRRLQLLKLADIVPDDVAPADIDETPLKNETPRELAERLAREKVLAVHKAGQFTLGGDTVVAMGRRMLPKAESDEEVAECLTLLSGRAHQVLTGISVMAPDGRQSVRVVTARVVLKRLTDRDVSRYVACKDGIGKAGGYAIQGPAAALIKSINGSYTAIVGLPLYDAVSMLEGMGYQRD